MTALSSFAGAQGGEGGFFRGLEREWRVELETRAAGAAGAEGGPADPAGPRDSHDGCSGVLLVESWNAEPDHELLPLMEAAIAGVVGEGDPSAGNVFHESRVDRLRRVFAKPDRPAVRKPLLVLLLGAAVHVNYPVCSLPDGYFGILGPEVDPKSAVPCTPPAKMARRCDKDAPIRVSIPTSRGGSSLHKLLF